MNGVRRVAADSSWSRTIPLFKVASSGSGDWAPDGKSIAFIGSAAGLYQVDADGKNPHLLSAFPPGFTPFFARWPAEGRLIYYSGIKADGTYLIYAVPAQGGRSREVAHSEGPTYQNFRFTFDVRGDTLYAGMADRQSDVWMAEVNRR
jgi:hypothetical protein